jgi:hypothetical protein
LTCRHRRPEGWRDRQAQCGLTCDPFRCRRASGAG